MMAGNDLATEAPGVKMAKRKGRPRTSERDDVSVKIDRRVAARARIVASDAGIPLAKLLTEIVSSGIDKRYAAVVKKLNSEN